MRLHALLIGIDKYQDDRIPNLRFAVADARRFHDIAVAALHPSEISIGYLYDEAATRPAILKAIGTDLAAQAQPDDVVLIHFAAHGSPELNEGADATARYLVPYDAVYDNLLGTGIDMERDLTTLLRRLGARVVVVFLDACFSGRAGGRSFEGPRLHAARDLRRWSPQLPVMDLGVGRIVIAAADDDEVAIETSSAGHGLFSRAVIEALLDPSTDIPALAVSTLYDTVAARVTSETGGRQHPVMNGYTRIARIPYLRPTPTVAREPESHP
ncbi:caspase family protein [Nakamurella sp.]|uniref:caspase family protein n=1 Tax=Nakamurella sp. TaxID=1869182 RepID=UPI003B3B1946